jgi:exodeoxyribonuclease-5
MSNAQLTKDQQTAYDNIVTAITNRKTHVLQGYAGTGKTFLMGKIYDAFPNALFCAPTNKACQVLRQVLPNAAVDTVYKILCLRLNDQGFLDQYRTPSFEGIDLIVVDEASMVSQKVFNLLMEFVPKSVALLFVGDPEQLQPVKESESCVFHQGFATSKLTEIVRQQEGNEIIGVSKRIREGSFVYANYEAVPPATVRVVVDRKAGKLANIAFQLYTKYESPLLAFTNQTVNSVNNDVHKIIYGKTACRFSVGEKVIIGSPIINPFDKNKEILADNGDEFVIAAIRERGKLNGYDSWGIEFDSGLETYILKDHELPRYEKALLDLRDEALEGRRSAWGQLATLKSFHSDLRHPYARTIHKSQGSTFQKVALDMADITRCKTLDMYRRLLYVGVTRARESVYFLQ